MLWVSPGGPPAGNLKNPVLEGPPKHLTKLADLSSLVAVLLFLCLGVLWGRFVEGVLVSSRSNFCRYLRWSRASGVLWVSSCKQFLTLFAVLPRVWCALGKLLQAIFDAICGTPALLVCSG